MSALFSMDQLHNTTTTAVSPDRVDWCNLLGYRFIPAAAVIDFTSFLFPIPLNVTHYFVFPEVLFSMPKNSTVLNRSRNLPNGIYCIL